MVGLKVYLTRNHADDCDEQEFCTGRDSRTTAESPKGRFDDLVLVFLVDMAIA
jgi:hypothetical protein